MTCSLNGQPKDNPKDLKIIDLWLGSRRSALTRDCYRRDARRLMAHARKPLARIGLADLQAFDRALIDYGLAPISRGRTLAAVRSLMGFCHRMRHINSNPAKELPLPRYEARLAERVLSPRGLKRLLSLADSERDRILLNLLYFAGLRVSEACALRWRNVQFLARGGQVTVFGKNGRTRAITLPDGLLRELAGLRGNGSADAPVFASRTGKPLDRGRVRVILLEAARRAGITEPVSPHWLRHAHASHALDRGAPIHLVQATLGHRSVATTSAYLHARPTEMPGCLGHREEVTVMTAEHTKPPQNV